MTNKEQKKNQARQDRNQKHKKLIKKQFKKVAVYLKEKNPDENELKKLVSETQSVLDKAKKKRVVHRNKAARKKSQLYKNINKIREEASR